MERVKSERDRFIRFVLYSIESMSSGSNLSGHAWFIDDNGLIVGDHTSVKAGSIVIATGSRSGRLSRGSA